ncbi:MAG: mechanosensitive ion channel [Acidobacteriia bacterium]|nr:mechanosensitive ion channel [Terriglobia bacterium]MYG04303.1 mechanosensitive ion channel [Terriglobia bacterium]MYK11856.1 mechanosensitive ion channel [Terriglobia bacterium]
MNQLLIQKLLDSGLSERVAHLTADSLEILLIGCIAWLGRFICLKVIVRAVRKAASKTESTWDDRLVERRVFAQLSHLVPALIIYLLGPQVLISASLSLWVMRGAELYALVALLTTANRVLTVAREIYEEEYEIARRFPIRVYVQVLKILLSVGAIILGVSIVTGNSPLLLLSGLGAMMAVILLVSKDSLQGLVAGIQLVSNDMVRPGDWVEVPQHGADGDVIEITLHTVKVQNWDKTIATVPTYALISEGFKNWRGMEESDGRRVKRSIFLDVSSVRFCQPEMIEHFKSIEILREYVERKQAELAEHNRAHGINEAVGVNGRRMTNVGVFRNYLVAYLSAHPMVNSSMTLIVRQLQPTPQGLPLEVYAFIADKRWAEYEAVQSDIFDHIFAALPQFGLRAFQAPSGEDVTKAAEAVAAG